MAANFNSSLEKHIEWTEYINQRLEVIYKEICEYEKIINMQSDENLLELLERINDLHTAAKDLSPTTLNAELNVKAVNIDRQIDVLQNTMELLKLESPTTGGLQDAADVESMTD